MPSHAEVLVALHRRAEDVVSRLQGFADDETIQEGRALVAELRRAREFAILTRVAEAVSRQVPGDARIRTQYAQALIETGHATVALDVLRPLLTSMEATEAYGLIGRANKQIFFDAGDKTSPPAREALEQAIAAYRVPFESSPAKNHWHGVNLVAVLTAARRIGLGMAPSLNPLELAKRVIKALEELPPEDRDVWYHASVAEAHLALRNWGKIEEHLKLYVEGKGVDAFAIGSTLRQFTEVWGLDADRGQGRALVDILRARALCLPGGSLDLPVAEVRRLATAEPEAGKPEAVLGEDGPKTYQWMQLGMTRAQTVGALRRKATGRRHGTCFLVHARLLGLPGDELVVLTNHHVVNREGTGLAIGPKAAEVRFEAMPGAPRFDVDDVIWSSPQEALDASILRLTNPPAVLTSLAPSPYLPVLDPPQRVCVIGHPGGDELAISFQDNQLLDHEGPPAGVPTLDGRVRLHYRTPTKEGSSGSPVFNEDWDVIGLHHYGGKEGVARLNGKQGTYGANEGIWINSIIQAPKP